MTKPKTYGEYADQTPNVTVDIRVRDREITDDAWRVLNAENELSPDIVEQFNMCGDKHTYIDYHDDENVVLTTTTAKESDYKIALFSGIVGERFEMRSLIRDEWNEYYSEVSSVDELFPSIEEFNQSRTKENKRIARIGYERPTYETEKGGKFDGVRIEAEIDDNGEVLWKNFTARRQFAPGNPREVQIAINQGGGRIEMDPFENGFAKLELQFQTRSGRDIKPVVDYESTNVEPMDDINRKLSEFYDTVRRAKASQHGADLLSDLGACEGLQL